MNDAQFIRSTAPHVVEVADGSRNAKSKSAIIGTDVQQVDTHSTDFINADHSSELKTLLFDQQSKIAALAPQTLAPVVATVDPPLSSSTNAPPVIAALASLNPPSKQPITSRVQVKSHFSEQIGDLKAKNDRVRAELKRRETTTFTKT